MKMTPFGINPCVFNFTSSFTALDGLEFSQECDRGQYSYTFTFCQATETHQECSLNGGSLCQYDCASQGQYVNQLASWILSPPPTANYIDPIQGAKGGYEVIFQNGDACWGTKVNRTLHLFARCGTYTSMKVEEVDTCLYHMNSIHPLLCDDGNIYNDNNNNNNNNNNDNNNNNANNNVNDDNNHKSDSFSSLLLNLF
jgi:hypothetical protein